MSRYSCAIKPAASTGSRVRRAFGVSKEKNEQQGFTVDLQQTTKHGQHSFPITASRRKYYRRVRNKLNQTMKRLSFHPSVSCELLDGRKVLK